jgi:2-amino-4-hydroxy-6-hydroxymethyldihydropteridine diphosphokinase
MLCYIGLGSNLNQPKAQLVKAREQIAKLGQIVACSSIYQTKPMGDVEQEDYLNAVIAIDTKLSALELLNELQTIEHQQQRIRDIRWGPRTIDCDIILYDNQTIDHPRLIVPHYGLRERNFVLYPLLEIAPDSLLPDGTTIKQLAQSCPTQGIIKIDQF